MGKTFKSLPEMAKEHDGEWLLFYETMLKTIQWEIVRQGLELNRK